MSQPEIRKCQSCGGSGRARGVGEGKEQWPSECRECGGTGEVWSYPVGSERSSGISDVGWLAKEFAGSSAKHAAERSGCMLPIDTLRWVFRRPNVPEPVKDVYIVGLLLLGPLVGYLASVGPVMIVSLFFGGLEILRDPYFQTSLQLGLYGALFGGACALGSICLVLLAGWGREPIFQALVIAVKIALLGGLFLSVGIFLASLNPN